MGIPVPETEWKLLPGSNYKVTVYMWFCPVPPAECGQFYQGLFSDIFDGQTIIDWIEADNECTYNVLIGPPLGLMTNRIYSIEEV